MLPLTFLAGDDGTRVVFDNEKPKTSNEPQKIEFLEDVRGQGYLDVVTFKDRFMLDLHMLSLHLQNSDFDTNPENTYKCPKKLFDALDLKGYNTPEIVDLPPRFCKNMQQTCCLESDIEHLERIWSEEYSPKLKYFQFYFKYYIKGILSHHEEYKEKAKEVGNNHRQSYCRFAGKRLQEFELNDEKLAETLSIIDEFLLFDYRLKRSFMCMLCDYANLGFFDFKNQIFGLNRDFCTNLVENTFDYYHMMNTMVFRYINTLSVIVDCLPGLEDPNTPSVQIPELEYLQVEDDVDIETCAFAKERGYNVFVNCLNFCSDYPLWRPKLPMYRPLDKLAAIHTKVVKTLYEEKEDIVIVPPKQIAIEDIVKSKYSDLDLFNKWEKIFQTRQGMPFIHFTDLESPDI